jgi:hypothetical protein
LELLFFQLPLLISKYTFNNLTQEDMHILRSSAEIANF